VIEIESFFRECNETKYAGYHHAPIPSPLDSEADDVIGMISNLSARQLAGIRQMLLFGQAGVLNSYSERMASQAVRTGDPQFLQRALVAVALAGSSKEFDMRDAHFPLAVIYRSAEKLRLDAQELFDAGAEFADGLFRKIMQEFPRRPPESRNLRAFDFVESQDEYGFRYRRTW
jgi:hypothetical protein